MFANSPALVLNADFQPLSHFPLSLVPWKDAVSAVFKQTHVVVAEYDDIVVRSPSTTMRLPSVIALREYVRPPNRVAFTRFNLFLRDRFTCMYCEKQHRPNDLTFDHVIPRSRGGTTCWSNIVASCQDCNTMKDAKIIQPKRKPFEPTMHQLMAAQRHFPPNYLHETWVDYLFWDTELEK